MSYGYMNGVLRIDLSTGNIIKEPLEPEVQRKYIGGTGFAIKVLYDEVTPKIKPFDRDNLLIFAAGPLTGTLAAGSGRIDVTTKSPLTEAYGVANGGGFWGSELKYAGYDAIIVTGKAGSPVYIWIEDDKVEIRDATHLWGQDTWEATDNIKAESQDSYPDRVRVLAIGAAGEKLVKYASMTIDYHHSASRSGVGAVMGSKNLKAIAVSGSKTVAIAQPATFEEAVREQIRRSNNSRRGTEPTRELFLSSGDLPGRHYQAGMVPHWKALIRKAGTAYLGDVRHACHCCNIGENFAELKTGKYAGVKVGDLHTQAFLGWGASCGLDNQPAVYKCLELCERLGMDLACASNAIAFAMELYEKGIISKATTHGIELEWGNEDAVIKMIHKIACRDGFGDVLAEGSMRAGEKIGKGAKERAVHIGGMSPVPFDPRTGGTGVDAGWAWILGHVTSPRGGDNVKTTHMGCYYERVRVPSWMAGERLGMSKEEFNKWYVTQQLDVPEGTWQQVYGTPPKIEPLSFEGKAPLMVFLENEAAGTDASGICMLQLTGPTLLAKLLSTCIGEEITPTELLRIGERICTLRSAYNAREGLTRRKLDWPERFYTEGIGAGPALGAVLPRDLVNQTLNKYYQLREWDKETGIPTRGALEALDLKDVADELEGLGINVPSRR